MSLGGHPHLIRTQLQAQLVGEVVVRSSAAVVRRVSNMLAIELEGTPLDV